MLISIQITLYNNQISQKKIFKSIYIKNEYQYGLIFVKKSKH